MNDFRKIVALQVVSGLVAVLALSGTAPVSAQGQAGTTLSAEVTAAPHWTITYGWTIDKSVTPDTWDLFCGDSGTSQYTITVTKDNGTEEAWVEGQVCVTNGGERATEGLAIVAVLQNGYGPPNDYLTEAPVDVSSNPVLDPGETGCYSYRVNIPITGGAFPQPHAGGTYKVTANVTITNHSGSLGTPKGPSPSATTTFPYTPTKVNDTINVDDTNGGSWEFSASGSVSYTKAFTCADEGKNENTATIRETGQSDSATVTVKCYELEVKKDAKTSFTRTYNWTIDKVGDVSELTLAVGEQVTVGYTVTVDATYTDSDWAVSGKIRVYNPAPMAATINSISDVVSPDIAATVDCGVTFPYTLAAGGTLECTYSASLPDAEKRINTATATLQNYAYKYGGSMTENGTTDFSGTAEVSFSTATMTEDECITVGDDQSGSSEEVCATEAPKTFEYSLTVGPYDECGEYEFVNTASFAALDTDTTGSDSWTILVHVPCEGCTLTPGYWKTHSKYGPAPYDDTWALVGEDTPFFLSGQSWYRVLWTPPAGGNAYYILAHQYIAARLNILNGAASTPEVDAALAWATTFFDTYKPTDTLSKAVRNQATSYASLLDQYNNGYIGPGHCSE